MDPAINFDPWYLKPPQEANKIVHSEYYIKHGEKKNIRRKIFEQVEYDEFEKKNLVEFKQFVLQNNITSLPPSFRESTYLKMLQSGKYNMKKSLKALISHVEWINNPKLHTLDTFSTNFLTQGNVYLCGRDKLYRPVIYMDCENLNLKLQGAENIIQAMCVFLEMVKKNMFIGGKVENWIFIIDTRGKGIFDLPLKALGVIIDVMQVNFGGHLEKLFILNPSFGLSTTWSVIEKMIDEEAASKIKFLKKNKLDLLQQDIDPKYLQKKYSGTLDDLTQFWPPLDIYSSQEERDERVRKMNAHNEIVPQTGNGNTIQIDSGLEKQVEQTNQLNSKEINVNSKPIMLTETNQIKENIKQIEQEEEEQKQLMQKINNIYDNQQNGIIEQKHNNEIQLNKIPSPTSNLHKGERTNPNNKEELHMSQSFGNTAFYQQTKASSKKLIEEKKGDGKDALQKFEIKISKVDDVRIEYDNQNQFNNLDEHAKRGQDKKKTENNSEQRVEGGEEERRMKSNQDRKESEEKQKETHKEEFKEIEKGYVIVQEEEEEGETIQATDVNQYIKQSKNVFAKSSTIITENKKMVEIDQLESKNNRGGGCCSGSGDNGCNIF